MKLLHFSFVFIFAALAINSFVDAKVVAKRQWDWNNNFMAVQEEPNESGNNLSERESRNNPTNEESYEDVLSKQAEDGKPVEVETVAFSAVIVQVHDSPNATEQGEDETPPLLGEFELATVSPDDSNEEDESGLQHKKLSLGKLGKIIKGGLGGKGKGGRGGRLGGGRGCKGGRKGCGGKRPRKPCPNGKKRCGIGRQLGSWGRRILEKIPMGGSGGGYEYPGGDEYPYEGGYEGNNVDEYVDEYNGIDDNNGGHHGGDDGFGFGTDFEKNFDIHIDI